MRIGGRLVECITETPAPDSISMKLVARWIDRKSENRLTMRTTNSPRPNDLVQHVLFHFQEGLRGQVAGTDNPPAADWNPLAVDARVIEVEQDADRTCRAGRRTRPA